MELLDNASALGSIGSWAHVFSFIALYAVGIYELLAHRTEEAQKSRRFSHLAIVMIFILASIDMLAFFVDKRKDHLDEAHSKDAQQRLQKEIADLRAEQGDRHLGADVATKLCSALKAQGLEKVHTALASNVYEATVYYNEIRAALKACGVQPVTVDNSAGFTGNGIGIVTMHGAAVPANALALAKALKVAGLAYFTSKDEKFSMLTYNDYFFWVGDNPRSRTIPKPDY